MSCSHRRDARKLSSFVATDGVNWIVNSLRSNNSYLPLAFACRDSWRHQPTSTALAAE